MGDAGYFRGTSAEQDNRFSDKEKKLMKQMKFAESLATKVDMSKVKLDVIKPWITTRISDLLGMEDDVLVEFVSNQLEQDNFPDGRRIQINLTGFLNGKNARLFTGELWDLLVSAQEQTSGIPTAILESKKEEIKLRQEQTEKTLREVQKTVGKFQDKLLQDIKKERESPPPQREGRNSFPNDNSSSQGQGRSFRPPSNYNSSRDSDRDRERERDRDKDKDKKPSEPQPDAKVKNYRPHANRRSKSRSRSPPVHHSKPRDGSRDRDRDRDRDRERDRRDRGDRDRDRDRGRGGVDLMDEIRHDRGKDKRRPSPVHQQDQRRPPRRYSPPPPPSNQRSRFETSEIKRALPSYEDDRGRDKRDTRMKRRPISPERPPPPNVVVRSNSSASSRSESEEENDEPKKKKKKKTRAASSGEDSESPSSKPKKKKKKKHKKHKKGKKSKKEKDRKVSADEDEGSDSSQPEEDDQDDDPPSPAIIERKSREELEKSLRERALESMKRRISISKDD